jgi:hypothetical protein
LATSFGCKISNHDWPSKSPCNAHEPHHK